MACWRSTMPSLAGRSPASAKICSSRWAHRSAALWTAPACIKRWSSAWRNALPSWQKPPEKPRRPKLLLNILLAEDHPVNQKLALLMLKRLGYRADMAANGLEILQTLERQPYDVVLMDVQMPEMDELEATRQIRRRPSGVQPRIIAMTANAMKEDREACFAAGMDDYLGKPIRMEELVATLSRSHPLAEPAQEAGEAEAPVGALGSALPGSAPQVTPSAAELEEMGKAGTLEGAVALVALVEAEYAGVKVALEAVRSGDYRGRGAT